ncbi:MAG: hypothetical protein CME62_09175 [Halobacteriovoraceae bacterium]|nr:hypothetical protein [Halobacteriovoraceae bacterium]|tara:strand:+ start:1105 stop:1941 length:837 start_codon:yes stop_codon:yes gene_type:complete
MHNVDFDIITIVKGRKKQLRNQINSIMNSTLKPRHHYVIFMNEKDIIDIPFGYKLSSYTIYDNNNLPLAKARNEGLKKTLSDKVVFLDVDCIVSPTLFENMIRKKTSRNILTAYPKYLNHVPENEEYSDLFTQAVDHPRRKSIPSSTQVPWKKFWSLVFMVEKDQMEAVGGFDENFRGYGAEDTDLAMSLERGGYELNFVEDYILHQYHTKYTPPLQHIESIVENANYYYRKWNKWPMEKWLHAFAENKFIKWTENKLKLERLPNQLEIKQCFSTEPY